MEYLMSLDLAGMSLALLMVIGAVNVGDIVSSKFFSRPLSSFEKVALSFVVALLIGFIPVDVQSVILERIIGALQVAFAGSGVYKGLQVLGGKR